MKKIIAILLVVCCCVSLVSCGKPTLDDKVEEIVNTAVGQKVRFGNYYGQEIEWYVLRCFKNKVMLVSVDILDMQLYHNTVEEVTWETCDLRKWLNDTFYNSAFSKEEQKYIPLTTVSTPESPRYGTAGGNDTQDYVFLLSHTEALYRSDHNHLGDLWWLRSPITKHEMEYKNDIYISHYGAVIDKDGKLQEGIKGAELEFASKQGVRPAICVEYSVR